MRPNNDCEAGCTVIGSANNPRHPLNQSDAKIETNCLGFYHTCVNQQVLPSRCHWLIVILSTTLIGHCIHFDFR